VLISLTAGLILGLFGYSQWAVKKAGADYPPIGNFVIIDGLRIHYLDSAPNDNSKQTIVLLHGASSNLRDFAISLFPALLPHYRVIAIDRPGHGYSDRPVSNNDAKWSNPEIQARIIHGALSTLHIHRPLLVGHSWAGSVALAYALNYPQQTGAVVVLSGATHPWRGTTAFYNRWPAKPVLGNVFVKLLLAPGFYFTAEDAINRNFMPEVARPNYAHDAGLALLVRPANWRANAEDMRNLAEFLAQQKNRYGEINVNETPLTIITSDSDRSVSAENHAYKLHNQVAGSELAVLRGAGHMPHHTRTAEVASMISATARKIKQ